MKFRERRENSVVASTESAGISADSSSELGRTLGRAAPVY